MPELVNHARSNHARWRELDDAGVSTLADVWRALGHSSIHGQLQAAQPTAEE